MTLRAPLVLVLSPVAGVCVAAVLWLVRTQPQAPPSYSSYRSYRDISDLTGRIGKSYAYTEADFALLRRALKEEPSGGKLHALYCFGYVRPRQQQSIVVEIMTPYLDEPAIRKPARLIMQTYLGTGGEEAKRLIKSLSADKDPNVASVAADALARGGLVPK